MPSYCSIEDIKRRLNIEETETDYDSEITDCRKEAQAWIDNKLGTYTTVPLTVIPAMITFACADLATAVYKRRQMPPETDSMWWALGNEKLDAYMKEAFPESVVGPEGGGFKVCQA